MTVVQEVAKYLRSSERFAINFGTKAAADAVAVVENFSFAPQRFASRERPLSRFVLFAKPILETLGLEVLMPTSPKRKTWAADILRQLDGNAWTMIGMLADLADDCQRFVSEIDERELSPMAFAEHLQSFMLSIHRDYEQGGMWRHRKNTYVSRIMARIYHSTPRKYFFLRKAS